MCRCRFKMSLKTGIQMIELLYAFQESNIICLSRINREFSIAQLGVFCPNEWLNVARSKLASWSILNIDRIAISSSIRTYVYPLNISGWPLCLLLA